MPSLAQLKKKRGSQLAEMQKKLEEQSKSSGYTRDERIWKPKFNTDKGKGTCIVRFLTPKEGDPFVELKTYQFQGPGGNYWDNALQTLGVDDPIQIAAINGFRKAKTEGDAQLRAYCKKFIPKSAFYANIYVIKDEEVPENEGKVFIWQFGPAIYKKLKEAIEPEFDDQEAFDPFDYWEGADFIVRMVGQEIPDSKTGKKITVPNYDKASFARTTEFMEGDEDAIDGIYQQTYDLSDFTDPSKFKSFEEVAEKFKKVTGKPYNWLSSEGVEEHVEEQSSKVKQEDEGNKGLEEEPPFKVDETSNEDGAGVSFEEEENDDDDDPVARLNKLLNK